MKNKSFIISVKLAIILVVLIITTIILFIYHDSRKSIIIQNEFDEFEIKSLELIKTVYFEDFGLDNITCTGLTYDNKDHCFWIADYGSINKNDSPIPRLIEVNFELNKVIKIMPIHKIINDDANVQGITYDSKNDSIIVATGKYIYNIDKTGNEIKHFSLGKYSKYSANGVAFNNNEETLWTLLYSKYLLQYDNNDNLIKKIKMNYKDQDQIFIDTDINHMFISVGADYNGNNNFVLDYNLNNNSNYRLYRVINSYAIEGISVVDGRMYVINDGLYHSAKIKKSYINIYNFNE